MTLPFFTNLLILLIAARFLGEIFELFRQPAMIGEILAGVLLGPSMIGLINPTDDIKVIADLGVFLLIILAGLEINVSDVIKSLRGYNIFIPLSAFIIPFVCGFMLGEIFQMQLIPSIFIGLCISITALPVTIRVLMDMNVLNTDTGQKILSAAIVQDIFALTILGIIINIQEVGSSWQDITISIGASILKLVVFITLLAVVYMIVNKLSKKANLAEDSINKLLDFLKGKESLLALFFMFVLIFATIAENLGFHFIIGAFFASMLINKRNVGEEHHQTIAKTTNGLAMGFLSPIFFAYIGLEFNLISIANVWLVIGVLFVSYFSKIFGGFLGGKLARLSNAKSLSIGIALNARGIMEIVIANIAYKANLINAELFSIIILMSITTVLTLPSMLKWSIKKQYGNI